ncbi:uncharacterized protein I206_104546 [Kwoniella pini CBS 10737]|uniref:F-box domain-containing protein n=1 Tax=Kwoniella pini CBS 10737 TaxID=1296096 RepID=A0A1B9I747_9TREE|nr:uncharacterized protein I206_02079 [Kwoniella pini CBS 10737]OCF51365.1 hypothetical protein I206_02079 [Kwoniella pini CBS 10737]
MSHLNQEYLLPHFNEIVVTNFFFLKPSSPKFPEDILDSIFDTFTSMNFDYLKTAVLINKSMYNRYSPRLYRHVSFNQYTISSFQLPELPKRFKTLCQTITHLSICDKEASQGIAQILSSIPKRISTTLFKNVEYLILKDEVMRFLHKTDRHIKDNNSEFDSKQIVEILGKFLKPKHLCIEKLNSCDDKECATLKECDKKDPNLPEIWKLEILKKNWNLNSITFHNDIGSKRVIFSIIINQRFFLTQIPPRTTWFPWMEDYPTNSILISSTHKPFNFYPKKY